MGYRWNPVRVHLASGLALLAFLISGWIGSATPTQAQAVPTDTPFPTETKDNLATATYDPLTPTVTPFPVTPTKSGDDGGSLNGQSAGSVRQIYIPLISWSVIEALPTATPTATPLPTLTAPAAPPAALSRYMTLDNIDSRNYSD